MNLHDNQPRRDFIKKSLTSGLAIAAAVTTSGTLLQSLSANAAPVNARNEVKNGLAFGTNVMPRAQLSILACELALQKGSAANVTEFAGFELEEARAVVKVLKELGIPAPPVSGDGKAFLSKLGNLSGNEFDKLYMEAELSNHEYLRDMTKDYLSNPAPTSQGEKEVRHLATLALFAFDEHVALCTRIKKEVNN